MPVGIKPTSVADFTLPHDANDALTHFIGISMDRASFSVRIYTTNRWVTGEV